MGRKKKQEAEPIGTCIDGLGRTVHVWPDGNRTKEYDAIDFVQTGNQWCPDCHKMMVRKEYMWECPICFDYFTDEDVEMTGGYPTYESTFKDDFGPGFMDYQSIWGSGEDDNTLEWEDL